MSDTPSRSEFVTVGSSVIEALRSDGKGWVVVKQVCGLLGLAFEPQRKRLDRQPWAFTSIMEAEGSDGRRCQMFCLDAAKVGMWLATIDTSRVKDAAVRYRLGELQIQAAVALDRWLRGADEPAPASGDPLDLFEQMFHAMKAQRQKVQQLEAQQAQIAATQAEQGLEVRELKLRQDQALSALAVEVPRAPELPGISLRTTINNLVRAGAVAAGIEIADAWRLIYLRMKDHYHVDVRARADKRRMSKMDVCEADGLLDMLLAVVKRYFPAPVQALAGREAYYA